MITTRRYALWPLITSILVVAAITGCGEATSDQPYAQLSGTVERVVDGDTIVVNLGDHIERVRYIGIDTPETVKPNAPVGCFGPQASHANKQLLPAGSKVRLVLDAEPRDRYGRLLAYVYAGSTAGKELFINADLVRRGYADTLRFPPNTSHAAQFAQLRRAASHDRLGLWQYCR